MLDDSARHGISDSKALLGNGDCLFAAVNLDASFGVGRIFDYTHQAFMRTLSNGHSLADKSVPTHGARWRHDGNIGLTLTRSLHGRVHLHKIRGSSTDPTSLGGNGLDVVGTHDKDTSILRLLTVVGKEEIPVDM